MLEQLLIFDLTLFLLGEEKINFCFAPLVPCWEQFSCWGVSAVSATGNFIATTAALEKYKKLQHTEITYQFLMPSYVVNRAQLQGNVII